MTLLFPGLEVSPIGFGGMAITPVYGGTDDASAEKTLHAAIDSRCLWRPARNQRAAHRPRA